MSIWCLTHHSTGRCADTIATHSDADYLYKSENGNWEYSRGLGKVGKKYIIEHYEAYGVPEPPRITHDAINDAYLEKSSVVHYCNQGNWVALTGAD